jgi:hypothetical protein
MAGDVFRLVQGTAQAEFHCSSLTSRTGDAAVSWLPDSRLQLVLAVRPQVTGLSLSRFWRWRHLIGYFNPSQPTTSFAIQGPQTTARGMANAATFGGVLYHTSEGRGLIDRSPRWESRMAG